VYALDRESCAEKRLSPSLSASNTGVGLSYKGTK